MSVKDIWFIVIILLLFLGLTLQYSLGYLKVEDDCIERREIASSQKGPEDDRTQTLTEIKTRDCK